MSATTLVRGVIPRTSAFDHLVHGGLRGVVVHRDPLDARAGALPEQPQAVLGRVEVVRRREHLVAGAELEAAVHEAEAHRGAVGERVLRGAPPGTPRRPCAPPSRGRSPRSARPPCRGRARRGSRRSRPRGAWCAARGRTPRTVPSPGRAGTAPAPSPSPAGRNRWRPSRSPWAARRTGRCSCRCLRACRRSRSRRAARPRRRPDLRRARRVETRGSSAHLAAGWLGDAMSATGSTRDCDVVVVGLGPGRRARRAQARARPGSTWWGSTGAGRRRVPVLGLHPVQDDDPRRGPARRGAACRPAGRRRRGAAGLGAGRGADPERPTTTGPTAARRAARGGRASGSSAATAGSAGPAGRVEVDGDDVRSRARGVVLDTGTEPLRPADRRPGGHAVLDQPRGDAADRGPGLAGRDRRRRDRAASSRRRSRGSACR